jgi:hypothetical protein
MNGNFVGSIPTEEESTLNILDREQIIAKFQEEIAEEDKTPRLKVEIDTEDISNKVNCVKDILKSNPNSTIKSIKKALLDTSFKLENDDEIKKIIEEANPEKYNELYPIQNSSQNTHKNSTRYKLSPQFKDYITLHAKDLTPKKCIEYLQSDPIEYKKFTNIIPNQEKRIKFFKNSLRMIRINTNQTCQSSMAIKAQLTRKETNKKTYQTTTDKITVDILKQDDKQNDPQTTFSEEEIIFLEPLFEEPIKNYKTISFYKKIITDKFNKKFINHQVTEEKIGTQFYSSKAWKNKPKNWKTQRKSMPSNKPKSTATQDNPKKIDNISKSNQHILGSKIIELVRSGMTKDILQSHRVTIREILTIPDVKSEEFNLAIEVLKILEP